MGHPVLNRFSLIAFCFQAKCYGFSYSQRKRTRASFHPPACSTWSPHILVALTSRCFLGLPVDSRSSDFQVLNRESWGPLGHLSFSPPPHIHSISKSSRFYSQNAITSHSLLCSPPSLPPLHTHLASTTSAWIMLLSLSCSVCFRYCQLINWQLVPSSSKPIRFTEEKSSITLDRQKTSKV